MSLAGSQRQLFLHDTYKTEVETKISGRGQIEGRVWVTTVDNIFHPQGGGQPADVGTLNGVPVRPRWSTNVPHCVELEFVADIPSLEEGGSVTLSVDAARRRLHAALHTAGHLLDAAVRKRGYQHIVSNHFPDEARIEFSTQGLEHDAEAFRQEVEREVNDVIAQNVPVTESVDGEGRRTVIIGEFSKDLCGGTHVARTSDIAAFAVRSVKVKKGRLKVGYAAEHAHE